MVRVGLYLCECATDTVLSQHHRTLLVVFFKDKTRDINTRRGFYYRMLNKAAQDQMTRLSSRLKQN